MMKNSSSITIDCNGYLYKCYSLVGTEKINNQNVNNRSIENILPIVKLNKCKGCELWSICGGRCRSNQLNTTVADILYLSYNVKMLENQYKLFNEKYDSTKEEFIEYKNTVLNFEFIIKNFAINNIINGDYNNV